MEASEVTEAQITNARDFILKVTTYKRATRGMMIVDLDDLAKIVAWYAELRILGERENRLNRSADVR